MLNLRCLKAASTHRLDRLRLCRLHSLLRRILGHILVRQAPPLVQHFARVADLHAQANVFSCNFTKISKCFLDSAAQVTRMKRHGFHALRSGLLTPTFKGCKCSLHLQYCPQQAHVLQICTIARALHVRSQRLL